MSCLHLLGAFDLAYRKTFVITVIWEDMEIHDHFFIFSIIFDWKMFIYLIFLNFFLIADYSMIR